jgi:hypothetical protein
VALTGLLTPKTGDALALMLGVLGALLGAPLVAAANP